jgi:hypothetical protein
MEASHDALQEGMVPLESGTASGSDKPIGISPDPHLQKNSGTPEHHHQTSPPTGTRHHDLAVNFTVSSRIARDLYSEDTRQRRDRGQWLHSRAGRIHLHHRAAVIDQTKHPKHTRPTGPAGPRRARKAPVVLLRHAGC